MSEPPATNYKQLGPFVPEMVKQFIVSKSTSHTGFNAPMKQKAKGVVVFADVAGFTKMSESMSLKGPVGVEKLTFYLNAHLEIMVRIFSQAGGDVFKFAGDAMMVLWAIEDEKRGDSLCDLVHRATQSCLELQNELQNFMIGELAENMELDTQMSVKLGVGAGNITILHMGGVFGRLEYLCCGTALAQSCAAQEHCNSGDIVLNESAWTEVTHIFRGKLLSGNFVKVTGQKRSTRLKHKPKRFKFKTGGQSLPRLQRYLPAAVVPKLAFMSKMWLGEHRQVSCLFLNLGFGQSSLSNPTKSVLETIQLVVSEVQKAVYEFEGSINKFMVDDKGSVVLIFFGLSPVAHEDDPARAVLAALRIQERINVAKSSLLTSMGITSGLATAGLVGSDTRREYTCLGDVVNTSARLMSKAKGTLMCDGPTYEQASLRCPFLNFKKLVPLKLKGKTTLVKVYTPQKIVDTPLKIAERCDPAEHAKFAATPIGRRRELKFVDSILERFVSTQQPHCLVVSGVPGVGKSYFMRHIVHAKSSTFSNNHSKRFMFLYGAGNAFTRSNGEDGLRPTEPHYYRVWQQLFHQLFHYKSDIHIDDVPSRMTWVKSIISRECPRHIDLLPDLNQILGTNFPTDTDARVWKNRDSKYVDILLAVLQAWILKTYVIVLCLDQVEHMTLDDWALTLAFCSRITREGGMAGVCMWICARPMERKIYAPAHYTPVPTQYIQLMDMCEVLELHNLTNSHHIRSLLSAFVPEATNRNAGVGNELLKLTRSLTCGNPMMIRELCLGYLKMGMLSSSIKSSHERERELLELDDSKTTTVDWNIGLPVPRAVGMLFMSQLDTLSQPLLMTLKVACVSCIGNDEFTFNARDVCQGFPLSELLNNQEITNAQIVKNLCELEQHGFVYAVSSDRGRAEWYEPDIVVASDNGLSEISSKTRFVFAHGYLRDTIYQLMLYRQRKFLHVSFIDNMKKRLKFIETQIITWEQKLAKRNSGGGESVSKLKRLNSQRTSSASSGKDVPRIDKHQRQVPQVLTSKAVPTSKFGFNKMAPIHEQGGSANGVDAVGAFATAGGVEGDDKSPNSDVRQVLPTQPDMHEPMYPGPMELSRHSSLEQSAWPDIGKFGEKFDDDEESINTAEQYNRDEFANWDNRKVARWDELVIVHGQRAIQYETLRNRTVACLRRHIRLCSLEFHTKNFHETETMVVMDEEKGLMRSQSMSDMIFESHYAGPNGQSKEFSGDISDDSDSDSDLQNKNDTANKKDGASMVVDTLCFCCAGRTGETEGAETREDSNVGAERSRNESALSRTLKSVSRNVVENAATDEFGHVFFEEKGHAKEGGDLIGTIAPNRMFRHSSLYRFADSDPRCFEEKENPSTSITFAQTYSESQSNNMKRNGLRTSHYRAGSVILPWFGLVNTNMYTSPDEVKEHQELIARRKQHLQWDESSVSLLPAHATGRSVKLLHKTELEWVVEHQASAFRNVDLQRIKKLNDDMAETLRAEKARRTKQQEQPDSKGQIDTPPSSNNTSNNQNSGNALKPHLSSASSGGGNLHKPSLKKLHSGNSTYAAGDRFVDTEEFLSAIRSTKNEMSYLNVVCAVQHARQGMKPPDVDGNLVDPRIRELQKLLTKASIYQFSPFQLHEVSHGHPLLFVSYYIIRYRQLDSKFNIQPHKLINFLRGLEHAINRGNNPYHNSIKAADTVQTCHALLTVLDGSVSEPIADVDVLALLLAAALHDFNHPGFTNHFLVSNMEAAGLFYPDHAILESYHVAAAFRFLKIHHFDIFNSMTHADVQRIRSRIVQFILITNLNAQAQDSFLQTWSRVMLKGDSPVTEMRAAAARPSNRNAFVTYGDSRRHSSLPNSSPTSLSKGGFFGNQFKADFDGGSVEMKRNSSDVQLSGLLANKRASESLITPLPMVSDSTPESHQSPVEQVGLGQVNRDSANVTPDMEKQFPFPQVNHYRSNGKKSRGSILKLKQRTPTKLNTSEDRVYTVRKGQLDTSSESKSLLVLKMVIKLADVGYPCKNTVLYEKWLDCLMDEFYTQGDREKAMNFPVSLYMNRNVDTVSQCQVSFIRNVVQPHVNALNAALPTAPFVRIMSQNMNEHMRRHMERMEHQPDAEFSTQQLQQENSPDTQARLGLMIDDDDDAQEDLVVETFQAPNTSPAIASDETVSKLATIPASRSGLLPRIEVHSQPPNPAPRTK